jgi:hypothetical protein
VSYCIANIQDPAVRKLLQSAIWNGFFCAGVSRFARRSAGFKRPAPADVGQRMVLTWGAAGRMICGSPVTVIA